MAIKAKKPKENEAPAPPGTTPSGPKMFCGSSSIEIKLVWSYDVRGIMVIFVQAAKTVQIHELQTQSTKRCFSYL